MNDKDRIIELENALRLLLNRAEQCDGWESFPSSWLEEAENCLNKQVDNEQD